MYRYNIIYKSKTQSLTYVLKKIFDDFLSHYKPKRASSFFPSLLFSNIYHNTSKLQQGIYRKNAELIIIELSYIFLWKMYYN